MLSLSGFKVHLNNIEHYTILHHAYKKEAFLKIAEQSKQVLLKHFQEQQNEIERLTLELNDWKDESMKQARRLSESEESHKETMELLKSIKKF